MRHVEFQSAFVFWYLLAGGLQNLLHVTAHVICVAGQTGHGVGQPGGWADFFDGVFQLNPDMLEQGFILVLFLFVDFVDIEITFFSTPELFAVIFV